MPRRLISLIAVIAGAVLSYTNLHSQPGGAVLSPQLLAESESRNVLAVVTVRGSLPTAGAPTALLRTAVERATTPVLTRHQLADHPTLKRLDYRPRFRVSASRDQLLALAADPDVVSIRPDFVLRPSRLGSSVPAIGAGVAHAGGLTGTGWAVAVVDTGVTRGHPFLNNEIVEEACFGTNDAGASQSMCEGGVEVANNEGSGEPCPEIELGCDHGTSVAAVIVGNNATVKGVAPDADLISVQVFSKLLTAELCDGAAPCIGAWAFDVELGLTYVFHVRDQFRVIEPGGVEAWDAVTKIGGANLSLGSDELWDSQDACEESGAPSAGFMRINDRIPEVAAAGQPLLGNGSATSLPAPACMPGVISVGALQPPYTNSPPPLPSLWPNSNRASFLTLLAPGVNINTATIAVGSPPGAFAPMTGTSFAAPHVTGAMALLRQHAPFTSVLNLTKTLQKSGDQVTDLATGNTYRTLRLDRALRVPFQSDIFTNTLVQTFEDTTLQVPLKVSDFDTPLEDLIVTVTSASPAVVPNDPAHISVTGSGVRRTINLTPALNATGTSLITVNVSDGTHDAETTPFTMTVLPVNDAPEIVPSNSNPTTPVGTPTQITVVVSDIDSNPAQLTLTASSLNQTLLPNPNILINPISTNASSRTFQVNLSPTPGVEGSSTVTFTARDGLGPQSGVTNRTILFSAGTPGSGPTVSAIGPQTTSENTPLIVPFTIGDPDTPLTSLTVTASSSNTAVVAQTGLLLSGNGADRSVAITPVNNQSGATTITLSVSDGSFIATTSFLVMVVDVAVAPVIAGPTSATTTPGTAVTLTMVVSDPDSPGSSLTLTGASSNVTLLPNAAIAITATITTANNRTFNVRLTPAGTLTGQATVTLTATDGGGAASTATIALVVALTNEAPLISFIPNQSTPLNTPAGPIPFTISDAETPAASLTVSGVSSNQALLPNANIVFAGSGGNRTVTLTPAGGQIGSALVTLTVSDGARSSIMQFTLTVTGAPPEPPTSVAASASGNVVAVSWTRSLTGPLPTSYVLEIGTAPGATSLPTQNTGNADTSLLLTLPDGTFYFRVRAVNSAGISGASPEASAVVGNAQLIPGPPSNFAVTTVGAGAVLTWSPPTVGAAVATYIIEAGSSPGAANLATLTTGSAATSYHVPFVPPGTYYVRVRGANAVGIGAPSQDVAFTMGGVSCAAAPGPPVLLTPVVAGTVVTLSWNAPAAGDPPSSYVLMAGSTSGSSNVAVFDTLSSATSFAAPVPNGTYFVRVASRNPCGESAPSNEMSFTIGTAAPGAPSSLAAAVGAGGSVTLNWAAPVTGGAPTGYVIEAGSAPGLSNVAVAPTGSTATTFGAVAPTGTYFVRVRAVNAGGASGASNEVVVIVP